MSDAPRTPGAEPRGPSAARLLRFAGRAWPWSLLLPVAWAWGVLVHESAHALAVRALGGRVLGWTLLPSIEDGRLWLGSVEWEGLGHAGDQAALAAPYALSTLVALIASTALGRQPAHGPLTRAAAVLLVLVPLVDVALGWSGAVLVPETSDLGRLLSGEPVFDRAWIGGLHVAALVWLAARTLRSAWPGSLTQADALVVAASLAALPAARDLAG